MSRQGDHHRLFSTPTMYSIKKDEDAQEDPRDSGTTRLLWKRHLACV